MIVPDINLLVYAYDTSSPFHGHASDWWVKCLSGTETVGLTHPVLFGFLRVTTSSRIFDRPMSLSEASNHIRQWHERGVTELLLENDSHANRVVELLRESGSSGGNLVTDAQIAALAIAHNAAVHTADRDFLRFPAVDCRFPLTD